LQKLYRLVANIESYVATNTSALLQVMTRHEMIDGAFGGCDNFFSHFVFIHIVQILMKHDDVTPFAPLLPSIASRTESTLSHGNTAHQPVLFISPFHFSRLFSDIENDYTALALGIKGTTATMNSSSIRSDNEVSPLQDLKRLTLKSKRFGFQMVNICIVTNPREIIVHFTCCRVICFISVCVWAALYHCLRK
jgi:hypothetical protein